MSGDRVELACDVWIMGVRVPAGFVTDGYTTPLGIGAWDTPEPAILHDWLYEAQMTTRRKADAMFRHAMWWYGVGWVRRWVYWAVVRLLGWTRWEARERNCLHC